MGRRKRVRAIKLTGDQLVRRVINHLRDKDYLYRMLFFGKINDGLHNVKLKGEQNGKEN